MAGGAAAAAAANYAVNVPDLKGLPPGMQDNKPKAIS
jgi:hypothetical protein